MTNIAPLDTMSDALDTMAKLVRVVAKEGVTSEQFRLPIDDQMARCNLAAFLKNGCQFIVKGSSVLAVDRTKPFDPVKFIGKGWSVVEEDPNSLKLTNVDFSAVRFESGLADGESTIDGEEKLKRLKLLPVIRLDAKIGQALYEEKGQTTLRFLHDNVGVTWFELAGTVLRGSGGRRYFLFLSRRLGGSWGWDFLWLDDDRFRGGVSPLLASLPAQAG